MARQADLEWGKYLLENGASPTLKNEQGKTPFALLFMRIMCCPKRLQTAAYEFADLLLSQCKNVNAQDIEGQTCLHDAVKHGFLEGVKYLIQNGASPVIQDKDGITPFEIAMNHILEHPNKLSDRVYEIAELLTS